MPRVFGAYSPKFKRKARLLNEKVRRKFTRQSFSLGEKLIHINGQINVIDQQIEHLEQTIRAMQKLDGKIEKQELKVQTAKNQLQTAVENQAGTKGPGYNAIMDSQKELQRLIVIDRNDLAKLLTEYRSEKAIAAKIASLQRERRILLDEAIDLVFQEQRVPNATPNLPAIDKHMTAAVG